MLKKKLIFIEMKLVKLVQEMVQNQELVQKLVKFVEELGKLDRFKILF